MITVAMRDDDLFPLSLIERRFWLWEHLFPAARVASLGVRVELSGAVDVDAWREAYAAVAWAPALRTRIVERDGMFLGRLGAPSALQVVEDANKAELERAFAEVIAAPYVADQDAVFRGRLVRFSSTQAVLFIGVHHAMIDGWTLASAIPRAFGAALRGRPPQWDVARWFAARAASLQPDPSKVAADRAFFAERLRRFTALPYPTPKVPPPSSSGRAHEALVPVSSALLAQVDSAASTLGARPVHLWLATVMTELARASGRRDVLLGTTNANRPAGSTDDGLDERSIGCMVRSSLLCASLPDGASFRDVVAAARAAVRDGLAHPDFMLEDLSQLGDDAPRASMVFNYLPIPAWADDLDGLVASSERLFSGGTGTTAAVSVNPKSSRPQLRVHLDADVFSADQALHLGERIVAILEAGLREPSLPMARLPRLLAHDRVAIERAQGRPESRSPVVGGTLGPLLAADFANEGGGPQRPALVHDDRVISRDELSARGRRLASRLVARGVGPGRFVVLQIHDPLLVMQAIVGVVWAGGAWVPTDVHSPPHRLEAIVDACDAALILRDDDVVAMLTEAVDAATLEGPWAAPRPVDPVYAIFTSGSTGRPKGVILSHDAVVTQLQGRVGLGFPRVRSYLNFAPFFFDGCIEPLLWTLTTGGTLHVLDEEQRKDPLLVRRLLRERAITNTSAVPTLWSAVLEAEDAPLLDLEFVIVGGEALTIPLVKKHREQAPRARLVNEYGPTESSVYSTAWDVPLAPLPTTILIGTSAPHVRCHVVDAFDELAPVNEPGELVVSGRGLADGYLKMPEETVSGPIGLATSSA
jgi:non-ribosomal peptide synthetase component F